MLLIADSSLPRPHIGNADWYWWLIALLVYGAIVYLLASDGSEDEENHGTR